MFNFHLQMVVMPDVYLSFDRRKLSQPEERLCADHDRHVLKPLVTCSHVTQGSVKQVSSSISIVSLLCLSCHSLSRYVVSWAHIRSWLSEPISVMEFRYKVL